MGDSVCTGITIVSDFFVETEETFEVLLLPNPDDLLAAVIVSGVDRSVVTISDSEEENSTFNVVIFSEMKLKTKSVLVGTKMKLIKTTNLRMGKATSKFFPNNINTL